MLAGRGPGPGLVRPVTKRGRTVFVGDWTDASGQRHRRHLGTDRRTAETVLARIIRERDAELLGLAPTSGPDALLREVVDAYLGDLASRARPRTLHDARVMLARALAEMDARTVRQVSRARVVAWRARRVAAGVSHKTANTEVGFLHAALAYAVELGTIASNPIAGLRGLPVGPRHRRRIPRALNEFELARLVAAADRLDEAASGLPYGPLLRALIGTGARWGELTAARWADIDWTRGSLTLRAENTKTQRTRTIPLEADLVETLAEYRGEIARRAGAEPEPGAVIFLASSGRPFGAGGINRFREWLYRAMGKAGIPKRDAAGRVFHVHALRHTFATRLARAGIPVQTCAALTGHRTVEILLTIYTHVEAEEARAAIEALPRLPRLGNL